MVAIFLIANFLFLKCSRLILGCLISSIPLVYLERGTDCAYPVQADFTCILSSEASTLVKMLFSKLPVYCFRPLQFDWKLEAASGKTPICRWMGSHGNSH